jgi:hypothetical protein
MLFRLASRVVSGALAGNFFSFCYSPFRWHSKQVANDSGRHTMAQSNNPPRSRLVEAIKIHDLTPGRDKVVDELLLRVGTSIDFSQSAELGV